MNTKINLTKFSQKSKIGALVGRYDESGQYSEEYFKDVPRKGFPRCVRAGMSKGYDISVLIFPHESIFAFTKNEHMDKLEQLIGENEMRELLDANAHYVVPEGKLLWAYRNFVKE